MDMSLISSREPEDAIAWAVRVSDPNFADWEAFETWLDSDPAHGVAFTRTMAAVEDAVEAIGACQPESIRHPEEGAKIWPLRSLRRIAPKRRWLPVGGLAIAASIAGLLFANQPDAVLQPRTIETAMGQQAHFILADGSKVEMAGGSRVTFDPARPREVTLERGRAMFTVVHDPASPFRVTAGPHRIVDVGTAFEIVRGSSTTDVSVADGSVVVDPEQKAIALPLVAGEGAVLRDGGATLKLSRSPDAIGQWRRDRMSYHDVPLAQVAADLSVVMGQRVTVGTGLRRRRFTGSIAVATVRSNPNELAGFLDVTVRVTDKGLELAAR